MCGPGHAADKNECARVENRCGRGCAGCSRPLERSGHVSTRRWGDVTLKGSWLGELFSTDEVDEVFAAAKEVSYRQEP